jgi:hypothetical protein
VAGGAQQRERERAPLPPSLSANHLLALRTLKTLPLWKFKCATPSLVNEASTAGASTAAARQTTGWTGA